MKKPLNESVAPKKNKRRLFVAYSLSFCLRDWARSTRDFALHLRHSCEILQSPSAFGFSVEADKNSKSFNGFILLFYHIF